MLKIIPKPSSIKELDGVFVLEDKISAFGDISSDILLELTNILLPIVGVSAVLKTEYEENGICFVKDDAVAEEGYTILIKEDGIKISAKDDRGFFYALMTIYQMLNQYGRKLPHILIEDYPRFKYRSFMLDVGRYFYSVQDVKHFIDIMAVLKINTFHIHLTEDQGWRVQIDKYPLLTEQGSKRRKTNFNCIPHGGFYTKEDIKHIVEYAHKNYIAVIPEIDMPGHMVAAISCYKHLGCFDRKLEVATHWGVKHDILCAGKDSTLEFVKDVLTEVIEMFPDGYIHIGGDEANKTRWKICPNCQAKIKELGLKNEDEVQSVFMNDVAKFIESKGYKAIIWNETEEDKYLSKSVLWNFYMYGEGDEKKNVPNLNKLFADEINSGRKCINVQSNAYYYDLPYHDISLKQAYEYEPMIEGIKKECEGNMIGVECDLWTEYVKNMKVASKKLFPRMFAMAESSWSDSKDKNYDEFVERLENPKEIVESITGYKTTSVKDANPNKAKAWFEKVWFERRQLHWQGLHNLIDDNNVRLKAKRDSKKIKNNK